MKLSELKEQITVGNIPYEFMIFECPSEFYIAEEYVKEIARLNNKTISYCDSLNDTPIGTGMDIFGFDDSLSVLYADTFCEITSDYGSFNNTVVICHKIDSKISEKVKKYTIKFPKPDEWQVCELVKTYCDNLDDNEIKWLYEATGGSLYRITNEASKIGLFSGNSQKNVLGHLRYDKNTDLVNFSVYTLCDEVVNQNKKYIYDVFYYNYLPSVEPVGFVNLLINKIKKTLIVAYSVGVDASDLGMSSAQFKYLKYNTKQSEKYLVTLLNFLIDFDSMVREGKIDIDKQTTMEYILCKILAIPKQ